MGGAFRLHQAPAHPAQQIGAAPGGPHQRQPRLVRHHPGRIHLGVQVDGVPVMDETAGGDMGPQQGQTRYVSPPTPGR